MALRPLELQLGRTLVGNGANTRAVILLSDGTSTISNVAHLSLFCKYSLTPVCRIPSAPSLLSLVQH